MGGKTRNIAFQLVLRQCCKTSVSCYPFVRPSKGARDMLPNLIRE